MPAVWCADLCLGPTQTHLTWAGRVQGAESWKPETPDQALPLALTFGQTTSLFSKPQLEKWTPQHLFCLHHEHVTRYSEAL